MNYYIVTGSSKGLGKSLTEELTGDNNHLFCISRKVNEKSQETVLKASVLVDYFEFDLNNIDEIPELMEQIFNKIGKAQVEEICLINNAGMLSPVKFLDETKPDEIKSNVTINLIAPLAITTEFLKLTKKLKAAKKIVNISSTASRSPRSQWACYNSSKAGMDSITQTVALEQRGREYPVRVISFYPGPMDTSMKKENRKTKPLFKRAVEFIRNVLSKNKAAVHHPDYVADRLVAYMLSTEFGKELFVSLEDLS